MGGWRLYLFLIIIAGIAQFVSSTEDRIKLVPTAKDNPRVTTPALHRGDRDTYDDGKEGKTTDRSRMRRQDNARHGLNAGRRTPLLQRAQRSKEKDKKVTVTVIPNATPTTGAGNLRTKRLEDDMWSEETTSLERRLHTKKADKTDNEGFTFSEGSYHEGGWATSQSPGTTGSGVLRKESTDSGAKREWLIDSDGDHIMLVPKDPAGWPSPSPTEHQHPVGTQWKGNSLSILQRMEQQLQKEREETLRQDAEEEKRKNKDQENVVIIGEGVKHKPAENFNRFEAKHDDARLGLEKPQNKNNTAFAERVVLDTLVVPMPNGELIAKSAVIMHHTIPQQKCKPIPKCGMSHSQNACPKCMNDKLFSASKKSDFDSVSDEDTTADLRSLGPLHQSSQVTSPGTKRFQTFKILIPVSNSPNEEEQRVTKPPLGSSVRFSGFRLNDSSGKPSDRYVTDNDTPEFDVSTENEIKRGPNVVLADSPFVVMQEGGPVKIESEATESAFGNKVTTGGMKFAKHPRIKEKGGDRKWRTSLPPALLILPDDQSQLPEGIRRRSSGH